MHLNFKEILNHTRKNVRALTGELRETKTSRNPVVSVVTGCVVIMNFLRALCGQDSHKAALHNVLVQIHERFGMPQCQGWYGCKVEVKP